MDFGFHQSLYRAVMMHSSGLDQIRRSLQVSINFYSLEQKTRICFSYLFCKFRPPFPVKVFSWKKRDSNLKKLSSWYYLKPYSNDIQMFENIFKFYKKKLICKSFRIIFVLNCHSSIKLFFKFWNFSFCFSRLTSTVAENPWPASTRDWTSRGSSSTTTPHSWSPKSLSTLPSDEMRYNQSH